MQLSRREQNKMLRRAQILKVSRRLFRANGYETTTMEDVAEHAGISKATLYNYFTSKEILLMGIAEAALEDVRQLVERDLCDEPRCVEKLRRALQMFVMDSIEYIELGRKITYLNSCEGSDLFATHLEMISIFRRLVEQAQAQGELRSDVSTDDIVDMVMGIYLVTQFQWQQVGAYSMAIYTKKLNCFFNLALSSVMILPDAAD